MIAIIFLEAKNAKYQSIFQKIQVLLVSSDTYVSYERFCLTGILRR